MNAFRAAPTRTFQLAPPSPACFPRSHAYRMSMEAPGNVSKVGLKDATNVQQCEKRVPLKLVVADCVKRWFKDYLSAAKAGDPEMQLLVGQMYNHGYGVQRDAEKGRFWLETAGRRFQELQNQ